MHDFVGGLRGPHLAVWIQRQSHLGAAFGTEDSNPGVCCSLRPSGCLGFRWQGSRRLARLCWRGPPASSVSLGLMFWVSPRMVGCTVAFYIVTHSKQNVSTEQKAATLLLTRPHRPRHLPAALENLRPLLGQTPLQAQDACWCPLTAFPAVGSSCLCGASVRERLGMPSQGSLTSRTGRVAVTRSRLGSLRRAGMKSGALGTPRALCRRPLICKMATTASPSPRPVGGIPP